MGRVLRFEESERYNLRCGIIHFLREDRRYQNVVLQELQPAWRRVGWREHTGTPPPWSEVNRAYWRHRDERINRYVELIRSRVGCFGFFDGRDSASNPRPAEWVAEYVHANASESPRLGFPLDPGSGATYAVESLSLTTRVSPAYALFSRLVEGLADDTPIQERSEWYISPDTPFSFDDWDAVRAQLHKIVDEWVDTAAPRFRELYPHRNAASLRLRIDSVEPLFRHLYHGAPLLDRVEREQLRRLANFLPLNFPAQKQHQ